MRKIGAVWVIYMLVLGIVGCSGKQNQENDGYSESFFAMDTYMTFTAYGADAETAVLAAEDEINKLEGLWSVTDVNSDVYAVNHSNGQVVTVDTKTAELLSFAFHMAEETDGALEPTIYPVLAAWGFTTGENHIPSETELEKFLKMVDYDKIRLEDNRIQVETNILSWCMLLWMRVSITLTCL